MLVPSSEILNYSLSDTCVYSPLETKASILRVKEYYLEDVRIDDLMLTVYEVSDSEVDISKPIVLGAEYKGGRQVLTGYARVLQLKEQGYTHVKAYMPYEVPKTLYHVSPDLDIIDSFVPRVPYEVMCNENSFEERICVSDSLEGCFSSAPWGGSVLEDTLYDEETGENSRMFRVYEFDTENILSGHIMTPEELHIRDYVLDALYKGEHWILTEEPYVCTYVLNVTDWEESAQDLLSHSDYEDLDKGMDYDNVWSGEFTTVIDSLTFELIET